MHQEEVCHGANMLLKGVFDRIMLLKGAFDGSCLLEFVFTNNFNFFFIRNIFIIIICNTIYKL